MNYNDDYISESVRGKIGQILRKKNDEKHIKSNWKNSGIKHVKMDDIGNKKFDEIETAYKGMREATSYNQYKKHFKKFVNITGIPGEQIVITKVNLSSKNNVNSVDVWYAVSEKKVTLPKGTVLIHKSPYENLPHIKPFFRGKETRGYLYSNERVYFTLKKDIIKIATDNKAKTKLYPYTPNETITTAWIDPLLPSYSWSCVYIDTSYPIKCHRADKDSKDKAMKESVEFEESMVDEPVFDTLEEFMEYYGMEFAEDDSTDGELFEEGIKDNLKNLSGSIKEKVGKVSRKLSSDKNFNKVWDDMATYIKHKRKAIQHDKMKSGELETLKKHYKTISETNIYQRYLLSFKWICKFFGVDNGVTIDHLWFNEDKVVLDYNDFKAKKITLPADVGLIHTSPKSDLPELEPTFRSKAKGKYLYPSKRVFFSVGKKAVKPTKCGLEGQKTFKYRPKEDIKAVYIDPTYPEFKLGYCYIDTSFPIPVERLDKVKEMKESVDETMLLLYESEMNGEISKEELDYLLDSLT